MRTQEQIIADCEARFAEIEAEAKRRDADPAIQRPCETCRFLSPFDSSGERWYSKGSISKHGTCDEPLVKGFAERGPKARLMPMPCGPEKALWQPMPEKPKPLTFWQCIFKFFGLTT